MKKNNSFEELCSNLEKNYPSPENEIICVKKYLTQKLKISKNKDILLKIKAEAVDEDYNTFLAIAISTLGMVVAAFALLISLLPDLSDNEKLIVNAVFLILLCFTFIYVYRKLFKKKYEFIQRWRKYIIIVIEDVINNLNDNSSNVSDNKQKSQKLQKSRKR